MAALFLFLIPSLASAQELYEPLKDANQPPINFQRYFTKDSLGRRITFYLSTSSSISKAPLAVIILGSGGQSVWMKHGDQISGGYQNILQGVAQGRARVMVVEKPGVEFCSMPERPGSAMGCPAEFLKEHTLPRWSEAVSASIKAAVKVPGIDGSRILVLGHSEGAITAAKVAADLPSVTHVAVLAGGGPSQLFDRMLVAGRDEALKQWSEIRKDPESSEKFAWGHPYRRWSSFMATSVSEELLKTKARAYAVHGSEDKAVPVQSFDVLVAELLARGRDLKWERIEGADHGFALPSDAGKPDGMRGVMARVLEWFLTK
jgi:predicted esterase